MDKTIGTIPEFTSDDAVAPEQIAEEVVQPTQTKETETPVPPAEKPTEEPTVPSAVPSSDETNHALTVLQSERVKLLKEIADLRGQKREIKQEQINSVQAQIDELKDIAPEDQVVMEKFLRAKGMVSKEEVSKMFYESVKTEELNKFLDKYPEYKPENDPSDTNWQTLQRELGFYRMPENPRLISEELERAHRALPRVSSPSIAPQKRQIEVAGVGSGGASKTPSGNKLTPEYRAMLKGFSDEDLQNIEKKLTN